jgi:hypothetical protein
MSSVLLAAGTPPMVGLALAALCVGVAVVFLTVFFWVLSGKRNDEN